MIVYRVANWEDHFENNRTRELKAMSWVPMPNKHDGDGYTQLIDHKDGAAHFGAWVLIVEVASKCDPRGTLLRQSGTGLREGHSAETLSRMTRCPVSVFRVAIERLCEIGWLETIHLETKGLADSPHESAAMTHEDATTPHRGALKEGKGREGTEGKEVPLPEELLTDDFKAAWSDWLAYKKERRESYKPLGAKHCLAALAKRGPVVAAASLRFSMAKNYQGPAEDSWMEKGVTQNGTGTRRDHAHTARTSGRNTHPDDIAADEKISYRSNPR